MTTLLISTYLDLKQLIRLELKLKQFPQVWKKIEFNVNAKPDQVLRKYLT